MGPINADGDDWRVALSAEDAFEIAMALRQAASQHPDCEVQVNFTDEDGTLKWVVKACPAQSDEAPDEQEP
jgi:uncharacterized protein GlcG (DUF336 family)